MDPDGASAIGYIILLFILIMLNAFFAMSEMAAISVNDNKVKKMAEDGDKKAQKFVDLLANPTGFLSTIQIGVTLSGFLASAVAADTFADMIVRHFSQYIAFISASTLRMITIVVITIILSYITLVFGELVPKRIAMHNPEKISFAFVGTLTVLTKMLTPMVKFLSASTNGVLRLFGIDPNEAPEEVTEEEIRLMLDVGGERGSIDESEKHMIHNIFEFDDIYVEEIMTHRTEIVAVDINSTLGEILDVALESGYSRIPVYDDDLDDIEGLIYVKDLLRLYVTRDLDMDETFNMSDYLRTPIYAIETITASELLAQFKETKIQIAVIIDEYGGTAGLVTMEDLLESIVGSIQDEYDDEEEDILQIGPDLYLVDGLTSLEDVFEYFHLVLSDDDDFDTIGGYILNRLGQIPGCDEKPSVMVENYRFTVNEMFERRIAKLTVEMLPEEDFLPDEDIEKDESSEKDRFRKRERSENNKDKNLANNK